MALKNLYSDLSTSGYPNHTNSELNYGAGSPIFGGTFEQIGLKFNKGTAYDQPDSGFSSEPFIKSPIQDGFANVGITFDSLTEGFIRGGAVTHAKRLATDTERISKFYLSPRGLGFLAKQVGLQASNPQIRPGGLFPSPSSNQRTYNLGVNTLAQVVASGTGLHVKREGLLPTSFNGYIDDLNLTRDNDSTTGISKGNRLLHLFETHISPNTSITPSDNKNNNEENGGFLSGVGNFIDGAVDTISELLGGNTTDPLYSFNGGAGSTYGIGQTTLYKYEDTNKGQIPRNIGGKGNKSKVYENRQGSISEYHVNLAKNELVKFPNLNAQDILLNKNNYDGIKDFIPFRFEAVNTEEPQKSDYIIFKAFIESFNDNYNASHNSFNYNGRGETFYTYNGFTRNIDFSFKIAAQSKKEILPLYTKLNYLVSNVAPEYSSVGRMRTPFIKLTVGDWCNKVPGVLNSIALSWQKDYPWQIENNEGILMLPHVLDINVQFTPIHNFMPEKSPNSQFFNLNLPPSVKADNDKVGTVEKTGTVDVGELIYNEDITRQERIGEAFNDGNPVSTPTTYN